MELTAAPGLRDRLAAALPVAMRSRDRVAVSALRSALARVSNAEAVHIDTVQRAGAIEHAYVGPGAADAARRELTESEVRTLVEDEVRERVDAATHLVEVGRPEVAERLLGEAAVLRAHLGGTGSGAR